MRKIYQEINSINMTVEAITFNLFSCCLPRTDSRKVSFSFNLNTLDIPSIQMHFYHIHNEYILIASFFIPSQIFLARYPHSPAPLSSPFIYT